MNGEAYDPADYLMRRGRPLVDASCGPSPQWRLRAPAELDQRMRAAAEEQGLSASELIRKAVAEYLNQREGGQRDER